MDLSDFLNKPYLVMGICNITPDSFYDGGRYNSKNAAIAHADNLIAQGADIIDIGGESTRPGANAVSAVEETQRVVPVIENIAKHHSVPISIDTTKRAVAQAAFDAGASWLNDISAGRFDPDIPKFAAEEDCPVVLMHSRDKPQTMQQHPHYDDVVKEVIYELNQSVTIFENSGVKKEKIILDPGIGFGKRIEDNLKLLNRLQDIIKLGYPVLVGTSRKSFIGKITGKDPDDRLEGSLGSIAGAFIRGAKIFRVHDVPQTVNFLKVLSSIEIL